MNIPIMLVVNFPDDFIPPEEFDEPTYENRYRSKCKLCPFYGWEDESGSGWCNCPDTMTTGERCPIKRFF